MGKTRYVMIDSVPLPEESLEVKIPLKYLKEFETDMRVVYRKWIFGIPVPELFLTQMLRNKEMLKDISERFEVMLIPKM